MIYANLLFPPSVVVSKWEYTMVHFPLLSGIEAAYKQWCNEHPSVYVSLLSLFPKREPKKWSHWVKMTHFTISATFYQIAAQKATELLFPPAIREDGSLLGGALKAGNQSSSCLTRRLRDHFPKTSYFIYLTNTFAQFSISKDKDYGSKLRKQREACSHFQFLLGTCHKTLSLSQVTALLPCFRGTGLTLCYQPWDFGVTVVTTSRRLPFWLPFCLEIASRFQLLQLDLGNFPGPALYFMIKDTQAQRQQLIFVKRTASRLVAPPPFARFQKLSSRPTRVHLLNPRSGKMKQLDHSQTPRFPWQHGLGKVISLSAWCPRTAKWRVAPSLVLLLLLFCQSKVWFQDPMEGLGLSIVHPKQGASWGP